MGWNCPECGCGNNDALTRCVCGHEAESKDPLTSESPVSEPPAASPKATRKDPAEPGPSAQTVKNVSASGLETAQGLAGEIDLSRESEESLRGIGRKYRKEWYGHSLAGAAVGLVLLALSAWLFWNMSGEMYETRQTLESMNGTERLVGETIAGPKKYLNLIGFGAGALGMPAGVIAFFFYLIRGLLGVPKSGTSPEATVRRFIENSLSTEKSAPMHLESFVCLLQNARDQLSDDYEAYCEFCRMVSRSIQKSLKALHKPKGKVEISSYEVKNIVRDDDPGNPVVVRVTIKTCSCRSLRSGDEEIRKDLPDSYLIIWLPVGRVGDRWYVGSIDWHGYVVKDANGPESEGIELAFFASEYMKRQSKRKKCGNVPT